MAIFFVRGYDCSQNLVFFTKVCGPFRRSSMALPFIKAGRFGKFKIGSVLGAVRTAAPIFGPFSVRFAVQNTVSVHFRFAVSSTVSVLSSYEGRNERCLQYV